jgi:hypothetical protein
MTKIASGSGSGSISQRHGSADPDPHQNVMDPQHCIKLKMKLYCFLGNNDALNIKKCKKCKIFNKIFNSKNLANRSRFRCGTFQRLDPEKIVLDVQHCFL